MLSLYFQDITCKKQIQIFTLKNKIILANHAGIHSVAILNILSAMSL